MQFTQKNPTKAIKMDNVKCFIYYERKCKEISVKKRDKHKQTIITGTNELQELIEANEEDQAFVILPTENNVISNNGERPIRSSRVLYNDTPVGLLSSKTKKERNEYYAYYTPFYFEESFKGIITYHIWQSKSTNIIEVLLNDQSIKSKDVVTVKKENDIYFILETIDESFLPFAAHIEIKET